MHLDTLACVVVIIFVVVGAARCDANRDSVNVNCQPVSVVGGGGGDVPS